VSNDLRETIQQTSTAWEPPYLIISDSPVTNAIAVCLFLLTTA
jgi:hypothetical protein